MDRNCLIAARTCRAKHLVNVLCDSELMTKTLQKSGTTLADVRELYDMDIRIQLSTESSLWLTVTIVLSALFEAAAAKSLVGSVHSFSYEKHTVMTPLPSQHAQEREQRAFSFADLAFEKKRIRFSKTEW